MRAPQTSLWAAWCRCFPVRSEAWPGPSLFPLHTAEHPELSAAAQWDFKTHNLELRRPTNTPEFDREWRYFYNRWVIYFFLLFGVDLENFRNMDVMKRTSLLSPDRVEPILCALLNLYFHIIILKISSFTSLWYYFIHCKDFTVRLWVHLDS